jgi:alkyl sulfatase BDS1-like metallo-beta-lactamase superfamily hydrolase
MNNGNLNNIKVEKALTADATLIINRSDIPKIILQQTSLEKLLENKTAQLNGDQSVLNTLLASLVEFDETFEIVPRPTEDQKVDAKYYETLEAHTHHH